MELIRFPYKARAVRQLFIVVFLLLVSAFMLLTVVRHGVEWQLVLAVCCLSALLVGGSVYVILTTHWCVALDDRGVHVRMATGVRLYEWADIIQVRPHWGDDIECVTKERGKIVLHLRGLSKEVRLAVIERLGPRDDEKTFRRETEGRGVVAARIGLVVYALWMLYIAGKNVWPWLKPEVDRLLGVFR